MVPSHEYHKSRAVGVTSKVGLQLTQIFQTSLFVSLWFCVLRKHGVFYTFAIPEVTWYEPLYNTYIIWFLNRYFVANILNKPENISLRTVKRSPVLLSNISSFIIFTNPSARAGYDTRSIFKRSLTGLNTEFSFS